MNIVGGLVDVHGTESLNPSVALTLFLAGTVLVRNAAIYFLIGTHNISEYNTRE